MAINNSKSHNSTKDKEKQAAKKAELKQFRHSISVLKKKGLIDKKYDARTATPTKYLKSQIKEFGDVISGNAVAAKVSKEKLAYYKEQGYKTKSGRVIVKKKENESITVSGGDIRRKVNYGNTSITKINAGLRYKDIQDWENQIRQLHLRLKPGEQISYELFGNQSAWSGRTIQEMIDYLSYYDSFKAVKKSRKAGEQQEYIQNIVIYKFEGGNKPDKKPPERKPKQFVPPEKFKKYYKNYVQRMSESERKEFYKNKAEKQSERRAKQLSRETDLQKELRLAKQREYAANYRNKMKKK